MTSAVRRTLGAAVAAIVLAVMAAPSGSQGASDWMLGDLFIGAGGIASGVYVRLDSLGEATGESVTDPIKGPGFTTGCAVNPTSGNLWITSFSGNTVTEFADTHDTQGEQPVVRVIDTRALNGRGASESVVFGPAGNLYVGNVDGTNPLLKFDLPGALAYPDPNRAPVCADAFPRPGAIWPPNHQQVIPIEILGVTDPDGDAIIVTVTAILQDEPTNTLGDGSTAIDGFGIGTSMPSVRAERSGTRSSKSKSSKSKRARRR